MTGETNLSALLIAIAPEVRSGRYVFAVTHGPVGAEVLASVVEPEGSSVVLRQEDADRVGLPYDYVAGWIILTVHSSLGAVGLTAAVSVALAEAGISCNVIAGYHHDHLFVPIERVDDALSQLERLSAQANLPGDQG